MGKRIKMCIRDRAEAGDAVKGLQGIIAFFAQVKACLLYTSPGDPGTDTPPDNNTGDKPDDPPAPAVSRQEAQSLLTAYLAQQGRTLTLVPLDSSPCLLYTSRCV